MSSYRSLASYRAVPNRSTGKLESNKFYRVALPWASIVSLATATATVAAYTSTPRVTSVSTRAVLLHYPVITTFVATVIGSILAGATSWAFSRSVTYWVCKVELKNGLQIDSLQSWNALATGSLRAQKSGWYLVTGVFVAILGLLTSGYTTLITLRLVVFLARPLFLSADASGANELDVTSSAFSDLYNSLNGTVPCSWPHYRGIMTPSCAWSNGFGGMVQSGRAAFESRALGITSFSRASALTFNGSPGGVFPFTSVAIASDSPNSQNSINTQNQIPMHVLQTSIGSSLVVGNLTSELQGLSANVSCQWLAKGTSPIHAVVTLASGGMYLINSTVDCNPAFRLTQYTSHNRMTAATCPGTPGTTRLYLTQYADYANGGIIEEFECMVSPYLTTNTIMFSFASNTSSIISSRTTPINPSGVLQAYLDSHVEHIPLAINIAAQSATNNLVSETIIALVSGFLPNNNGQQSGVWEHYFRGMIEYDGTHSRHFWEDKARNTNEFPTSGFRDVAGSFQYRAYGWHSTATVYIFSIPIIFITLLTIFTFALTYFLPSLLPDFDPIDTGSLLFATARGTLHKIVGIITDEKTFRETEVRFDDRSGGIVLRYQ